MIRICFVCLGNICRSPTAEAIFTRDVERAGLADRFVIDSAGTGDWHVGARAHGETRRVASARGVEIGHRARCFEPADFDRFDWVVAMDRSNQSDLLKRAPDLASRAKVQLFRPFDPEVGSDDEVPDPYSQGGFDAVFEICERASAGLLAHLRALHGL